VVDPSLADDRTLSLLTVVGGARVLTITPARAEQLALEAGAAVAPERLGELLETAGITLNGADYVFYLPVSERGALRAEPHPSTRQLTSDDEDAFGAFATAAPEDDLDEAFVELEHWLVFGTFVDGRLVAAASMYPWSDTQLADLGVITLPEYRGHGLARATVRAISDAAIGAGYEPQYRCQLDNAASIALARSAGFALFGEWNVIAG